MPPHIRQRWDRGSVWYLVDGRYQKSTRTTKKGLAQARLEQYIQGQFGLAPKVTIGEYYERWIKTKTALLIRRSLLKTYRQHWSCYLSRLSAIPFASLNVSSLIQLRESLSSRGLSLKTIRNILDGTLRALWRDAMAEEIVDKNPFALLQWPAIMRQKPDPFSAEERDRIVAWWRAKDFFYFPWVATLFHTGMRPSEAAALRWTDIDVETRTIAIVKSRDMGAEAAPKTAASRRAITVSEEVARALKLLPSRALGIEHVFVNKYGEPMYAKKWSEHYWREPLKKLGIRHRKFYATRHTFITEAIRRGGNPLAVAQYCGTSLAMIQADYCGPLSLDATVLEPSAPNSSESMVAGPGFEPGTSRL
jgi:integrase